MSAGFDWEGLKQVCATLLGARHVPERLCGGLVYLGRYNQINVHQLHLCIFALNFFWQKLIPLSPIM